MLAPDLKKVFDKAVRDAIEQTPVVSRGFREGRLDLKDHIDNEMVSILVS